MLKVELLEIITNGENSGVEFKRDDVRPEQVARELVAFLNFQGGRIILGVEDDGTISGIRRKNLEEWIMNLVSDRIHPQILPYYEELVIDDQRTVAVITVPPGLSKPYVAREAGAEKIYVRVGSTSRAATQKQQARLFELGGMFHTETLPVPRTDMGCLDEARLHNYLADVLRDPDVPRTPDEWQARLLGLGLLVKRDQHVLCSVVGLLLFGKSPRRFLKQAGLRVFVFPGADKDYHALLDDMIDGPLLGRWDYSGSGKSLIDAGLIERFVDRITPFISRQTKSPDAYFRRDHVWDYPPDALREGVVNALAHRDWTRSVEIEIGAYSDRLEIISPGSLFNTMTVEKIKAGHRGCEKIAERHRRGNFGRIVRKKSRAIYPILLGFFPTNPAQTSRLRSRPHIFSQPHRSPRNPILMEILRDYGYVDHRGMGVRAKMIPLMRVHNGVEPELIATEDYLKVVLPKGRAGGEN